MNRPREAAAWQKSEELAAQILTGEERLRNMTGGATHYHAVYMRPFWAPALEKTAHIGRHIFYRPGRENWPAIAAFSGRRRRGTPELSAAKAALAAQNL